MVGVAHSNPTKVVSLRITVCCAAALAPAALQVLPALTAPQDTVGPRASGVNRASKAFLAKMVTQERKAPLAPKVRVGFAN